MSTLIQVDSVPLIVKGDQIVEIEVNPIGFLGFQKIAAETNSLVPAGGKKWSIMNKRLRIKAQVRVINTAGVKGVLDDLEITQLPIAYANKMNTALNSGDGEPGKIINAGDGVATPILFALGTAIPVQSNNETVEIKELEFLATTFGDVEEVMAETDPLSQAVALLRSVAKPVGVNESLQRLPDFALERLKLADGFKIIDDVLPRFLG